MYILDLTKNSLLEDREEARQHGEAGPTDAAIATCMGIMGRVSPFVLMSSRVTWAAFGEGDGSVSLVARSLATNRRADFCISPDGLSVSVVCIDARLTTTITPLPLNDVKRLDGITQWVGVAPPLSAKNRPTHP